MSYVEKLIMNHPALTIQTFTISLENYFTAATSTRKYLQPTIDIFGATLKIVATGVVEHYNEFIVDKHVNLEELDTVTDICSQYALLRPPDNVDDPRYNGGIFVEIGRLYFATNSDTSMVERDLDFLGRYIILEELPLFKTMIKRLFFLMYRLDFNAEEYQAETAAGQKAQIMAGQKLPTFKRRLGRVLMETLPHDDNFGEWRSVISQLLRHTLPKSMYALRRTRKNYY
jgi:hypothetical protein